jgi:hypothetical protein
MPPRRGCFWALVPTAVLAVSASVTWHVQPSWFRGLVLRYGVYWALAPVAYGRVPLEPYAADLRDPERRSKLVFMLTWAGVPKAMAPELMRTVEEDPAANTSRHAVYALWRTVTRERPAWARPLRVAAFLARVAVEAPDDNARHEASRGLMAFQGETPSLLRPEAMAYLRAKAASGTPEERARARELLEALKQPSLPGVTRAPAPVTP